MMMTTTKGKAVITGSADTTVKVWNPRSGECVGTIGGVRFHKDPILCLAARDNERAKLVATGDEKGCVFLSNYETGNVSSSFPLLSSLISDCFPHHMTDSLWPICFQRSSPPSPLTTILLRVSSLSTSLSSPPFPSFPLDRRDLKRGRDLKRERASDRLNSLSYLASAGMDGKINIWDLQHGMLRNTLDHSVCIFSPLSSDSQTWHNTEQRMDGWMNGWMNRWIVSFRRSPRALVFPR